jgi:predicted phage-related endonuclease
VKKTAAEMIICKTREEWLARRTGYIGGSDAAAALGLSPWKTNVDLWEEKTGRKPAPDISNNAAVHCGAEA